jgi:hypothetical protein
METRIDARRIIKIRIYHKKPGDYKWYNYQEPVYEQRHPLLEWLIGWLVKPNIVYGGQAGVRWPANDQVRDGLQVWIALSIYHEMIDICESLRFQKQIGLLQLNR